jgi:FkbH-like protein
VYVKLTYPFDSEQILIKQKRLRRELLADGATRIEKRVAILGGSTTSDIRGCLELFLLSHGIKAEFYESEYGQYWQEAMFANPQLDTFKPDVIFIHTSLRNFADYDHFATMWERLSKIHRCPIIQNNFEYPFYRLMGNRDSSHGKIHAVTQMNLKFAEYAQTHDSFYINDINWLSADYGLKEWSDPFYWHMYKYALCLPAIPYFCHNVANIIKSLFGKNKKAFALDLDNTLWGGIVGDDGTDGLAMGQESSMGQVYSEFQAYLKEHKQIGVILNVVSKNDEENALAGLNHPASTLKPDDFIVIKSNWEPKSLNIADIAQELTLLPDSFVFVDDNPAEREIVRQQLDGIAIPELAKPEHYIHAIDRAGYFEVTSLTDDDRKRNDQYRENIERAKSRTTFADYRDYLLSLKMAAAVRPFESPYMSRIAQLTNKSNQFNLTTRRYTQTEIEAVADDPDRITLYSRLTDKFGDYGVVTVAIGRIEDTVLHIELWLMSCRVLKREMEDALLDELVRVATARGITELRGYYFPTAKNSMVRDLYGRMGFRKLSEDASGNSEWSLCVDGYQRRCSSIDLNGMGT